MSKYPGRKLDMDNPVRKRTAKEKKAKKIMDSEIIIIKLKP